jgi:hypothetical protein
VREGKGRERIGEGEVQHLESFNLRLKEFTPSCNPVLLTQLVLHPRHPVLKTTSNPLELLSLHIKP